MSKDKTQQNKPAKQNEPPEQKEQIAAGDQIQTVDQLMAAYPELVRQIIADAKKATVPDLKVPGFVLTLTDPFAAGTLRTFASLSGRPGLQLPFVLPFKNKHSAASIKGYIIRAEGGGDYERASAAKDKLKKFK